MSESNHELLFQALEYVAQLLEDVSTPENIRHDTEAVTLMASANRVAHTQGTAFVDALGRGAPTFDKLYTRVMLRDIREPLNNGIDQE